MVSNTRFAVYIVAAVLAGGLLTQIYHNYRYNAVSKFLVERGCVDVGPSSDAEVNKYLGHGFACGGVIVALPNL